MVLISFSHVLESAMHAKGPVLAMLNVIRRKGLEVIL